MKIGPLVDADVDAPRVLLPRPDHLGDVLLALHAALALRAVWPAARVTALVPTAAAPLAAACPAIDAVLTANFPPPTAPASPPGWESEVTRLAPTLAGAFDAALLTRIDDPWSGRLAARSAIPVRVGYAHPRTRRWLTRPLPLPQRQHVAQLALGVAHALTGVAVDPGSLGPLVIPPAADAEATDALLAGALPEAAGPLVVLHPGAGWELKHWPAARWGALARELRARGVTPVVTGSAAERALVDAVVAAGGAGVVGLAGALTLGMLMQLLRRAALVVAIDSGPLHLASALRTPVVGLYGPADPLEFGPWCPPDRARVVRHPLPCSPCRTLLAPPCGASSDPACMRGITVSDVLAAVAALVPRMAG